MLRSGCLSLDVTLLTRIVVGTALGSVIGYERDIHGRPAGLRTHALVALASSVFMVVSTHFVYYQHYSEHDLVAIDTSRIAASVVSGIGFLAGGAILRTGVTVQGLTTAAGLWLVAAIGLCAGGGMYPESVGATIIGIGALTALRRFEDKDDRIRRRLTLTFSDSATTVNDLLAKLASSDLPATIEAWDKDATSAQRRVTLAVRLRRDTGETALISLLEADPSISRIQLDPPSA